MATLTLSDSASSTFGELRQRLPSGGAAPISPAFAADWDDAGSADRVAMVASKSASAMADKAGAFTNYALAASGHMTYDTTFGSVGSGNNQFNNPQQLATDASGNLYVADSGNNRLKKHSSTGTYVTSVTSLADCYGAAVDVDGNVYATHESGAVTAIKRYKKIEPPVRWMYPL